MVLTAVLESPGMIKLYFFLLGSLSFPGGSDKQRTTFQVPHLEYRLFKKFIGFY